MEAVASDFFFGGMLGEELAADLDDELGADLDEELEVDEDESSASAPYLVRQMSCLGSRTPGVKDTPFLGSARGAKEAGRHLPREYLANFFRSMCKQATQRHREFTQVQAARRLKAYSCMSGLSGSSWCGIQRWLRVRTREVLARG